MISEIEGLDQDDKWGYLTDPWKKEELRLNLRSPRTGKKLVAWTQVSPSQIENYVKCKRAWFFKSVARVPEPQKGHQALGTSFHLIMEKVPKGLSWPSKEDTNATEEEWAKANQMANQALPLLPVEPSHIAVKREWGISLETYQGGPIMKGYIDLAIPPGIGWPAFLIPANEAIIGDYKTLSDFRYMKTPEELASSIQMMSYAKWAITDWPSGLVGATDPLPEHVRLLHVYARTKGPFNRNSIRHESAVVSVPEINLFWDKTLDIVREMQSTASACTNADDVEATGALTGHCEAYGGCHFRDKCGLAPKEASVKTLFQIGKKPASTTTPQDNTTMSGSPILQKILAARAAAAGITTPNQTQTQPEQGQASPTPAPAAVTPSPTQPVTAVSEAQVSTTGNVKPSEAPIQAKGPISGLLAKIQSTGHGTPKLTGSVAAQLNKETGQNLAEYPGEGFRAQTAVASVGELMKLASGIVPPDAPPRTQAVITTPGMAVADPEADPVTTEEGEEEDAQTTTPATAPDSQPATVSGSGVSTPAPSGSTTQTSTEPTNGQVEGAKKRGRPSKEETQAREAAEAAAFNAKVEAEVQKRMGLVHAVPTASSAQGSDSDSLQELQDAKDLLRDANKDINALKSELERAKSGSVNSGRSEGMTLYVDTLPVKGDPEVQDFHEWIRPATQAVEEAQGVADWRLINYVGKGLLAAQLRELIKLTGLPKAIAVPSFAAGADVAIEILSPLAKRVIRPLR
jgi:hypothetical protein